MSTNAPPVAFYKSSTQLTDAQFQHQCQLRPYDPPGCPDPFTPHHCVPDHCFVKVPERKKNKAIVTPEERIDILSTKINEPQRTQMSHAAGLCICLDGPSNTWGCNILDINRNDLSKSEVNKERLDTHINFLEDELKKTKISTKDKESLTTRRDALNNIRNQMGSKEKMPLNDFTQKITASSLVSATPGFANLGQHPRAHNIFDAAEKRLATDNENATPSLGQNVATLDQLENLAADVLSKITGCPRKALKRQMEYYHEQKGIPRHTLLRANTGGDLAKPANGHMLGNSVDPAPPYRMSRYLSREYRNRGI
ncbi:MAG TPA: hypothetical protein PKW35_16305 [Nannocystaceae bacterium]|nr:hypothetical protein [Nannocystaceae bacterium]